MGLTGDDIWDDLDDDGPARDDGKVKRDGRDRPYVYPPGYDGELNFDRTKPKGSPRTTYSRASSHGEALEDGTALDRYHQRNVIRGLVKDPKLIIAAKHAIDLGSPDDKIVKDALGYVALDARKAIYEDEKADRGTFVHLLCQLADEAIINGLAPHEALQIIRDFEGAEPYVNDVAAYLRLTLPVVRPLLVEQFLITDEIKIAGTTDRVVKWIGPNRSAPDESVNFGDVLIGDIKTGSIEWGIGKFAIQFAVYANACRYDQTTNTRSPIVDPTMAGVGNVSKQWGILIHVPSGAGTASLHWIDIAAGWRAACDLAGPVRKWRNDSKKLLTPLPEPTLMDRVRGALTADEARELYRLHSEDWTETMTEVAKGKAA